MLWSLAIFLSKFVTESHFRKLEKMGTTIDVLEIDGSSEVLEFKVPTHQQKPGTVTQRPLQRLNVITVELIPCLVSGSPRITSMATRSANTTIEISQIPSVIDMTIVQFR
jgi:hypothetical protein